MRYSFLFAISLCSLSYANEIVRLPEQNEVKMPLLKAEATYQTENFSSSALSSNLNKDTSQVLKYTARELIEQPDILEDLFLEALISTDTRLLTRYIKLYELVAHRDQSLIDWANAILLREHDLPASIKVFRMLNASFPENHFIRFQLAETLFYNQELEAAKMQFEKLRAESQNEKDIEVFNRFIQAIDTKTDWSFSFGASFLNDKNLTNSAKVGTSATLPNGTKITYSTPRQTGQGVSTWFTVGKRWNLANGRYWLWDSSLAGKYYWNNHYYNDLNSSLGLGLGYANTRWNIEIMPTYQKRWYAGGVGKGKALKQYTDTYGFTLSNHYWLNRKFKYSFQYDYGYERYQDTNYKRQYNGVSHNIVNSITYFPNTTQYWVGSLDLMKKEAKDKTNAYYRVGARLTWVKEWNSGLSTASAVGIAKRRYQESTFFGKVQQNHEYFASLSLWHKNIHFAGFTPKITYSYARTDSNIPIYSYDKHQLFFNIGKTF